MTDPKPEDLIPLSDDEIAFDVKMAIGRDAHGRMKAPRKNCPSWEGIGEDVARHFRRSRVRVFRLPPEPPPQYPMGHPIHSKKSGRES